MAQFTIDPVGVIHSPVRARNKMPIQGTIGCIEIFKEYSDALSGIGHYSHIILVGWMHEADRELHRGSSRKISSDLPKKGVFALRSPSRPNPLSVSVVGILACTHDRHLTVSHLDLIDGTPVIDIKPYQTSWDCVMSARNPDRTEKILRTSRAQFQDGLVREAFNYHGELCAGLALAVRMAFRATSDLGGDLRRSSIRFMPGKDPCINDAVLGMTGIRMGSDRMISASYPVLTGNSDSYSFFSADRGLVFTLKRPVPDTFTILTTSEQRLFTTTLFPRSGFPF
jgi:tRNA-Thr(GGU) m(6)t(6)A37 methyltransferase TsaA